MGERVILRETGRTDRITCRVPTLVRTDRITCHVLMAIRTDQITCRVPTAIRTGNRMHTLRRSLGKDSTTCHRGKSKGSLRTTTG